MPGKQASPKKQRRRSRTSSQSHSVSMDTSQSHPTSMDTTSADTSTSGKSLLSPKPERRRSASISEDKQRKQKEMTTEQYYNYRMHRVKFFDYEPQAINCLACDLDNDRLALSRSDGSIEIWTVTPESIDLCQQYVIHNESETSIEALLWHNGVLYKAGLDGDLVQYDMRLLKPKSCVPCHAGAIWCLSLNSAGTRIAAGTEEGCVVIFEFTGEGFQYLKSLQKQDERMISIDWHASGEVIVTGGIDNIRVWSVDSGNAVQRITVARQSAQKQTIVWAVAILKDRTIVSGDSRGKLTFWNGKHGTQLKMFSCHRADILSLAVSKDETQVYAAGIDPLVVQFDLAPVSASNDWVQWQRSSVRAHHSHDVRAVAMMDNLVISGGVDCSLIAVNYNEKLKYKTVPLPQHRLVHTAKGAKLLLLQYSTYLQLWTLGVTNIQLANREEGVTELPLSSTPANLLELRARNEDPIVCSAISHNASWIAYADRNSLRIFNLSLTQGEMLAQRVSASRLRGLPATLSTLPIRCLQFSGDGNLLVGYIDGSVKLIELKVSNLLPQIGSILSATPPAKGVDLGILRHMQVSQDGTMLAITDSKCNILVYHILANQIKLGCKLPKEEQLVTAMAFSANSECLAYCLSSHKVMEYNLSRRCYCTNSPSSTQRRKRGKTFGAVSKVINMQYARHDSRLVLLQDSLGVRIYNTETGVTSSKRNLYESRYLMHFEELEEDFALVVERHHVSLANALPQALSKKQYGT